MQITITGKVPTTLGFLFINMGIPLSYDLIIPSIIWRIIGFSLCMDSCKSLYASLYFMKYDLWSILIILCWSNPQRQGYPSLTSSILRSGPGTITDLEQKLSLQSHRIASSMQFSYELLHISMQARLYLYLQLYLLRYLPFRFKRNYTDTWNLTPLAWALRTSMY